jgi:Ni/Co efflux regulator RcnB
MRKLVLLAAMVATLMPSAALAARPYHDRHDRNELRGDRYVQRHDRRDLRRDRRAERNYSYDRHNGRHHSRVAYVAPYSSWSYRPVTVGYRLRPVFYSPRYYISDYGYYGLRVPPPWERWIRYGNDLLLVNLRTGRVLQVIHYRYW